MQFCSRDLVSNPVIKPNLRGIESSKNNSAWLYIHMAFLLLLYARLKRCNLPCVKILSDGCNGIRLSSWGDIFSTATVQRLTPLSSLGRRAPCARGTHLPRSHLCYPLQYDMIWQSINCPCAKQDPAIKAGQWRQGRLSCVGSHVRLKREFRLRIKKVK